MARSPDPWMWDVEQTESEGLTEDAPLVVDSFESLANIRRSWRIRALPSDTQIDLDASFVGAAAKRLEQRINEVYSDCGCTWGALGMALALLGYAAWFLVSDATFGWDVIARGSFIMLAGAVVGKLFGLAKSRFVLDSLLSAVERAARIEAETRASIG